MTAFTPTQCRYLAFIHAYTNRHGYPPAEAEIAAALCVSPPSVNQMVKTLEKKALILRQPGLPRSLQILVPDDEIPPWGSRKAATNPSHSDSLPRPPAPDAPPANLYVLLVHLLSGPVSKKFAKKEISRVIEIRGDQTRLFKSQRWRSPGRFPPPRSQTTCRPAASPPMTTSLFAPLRVVTQRWLFLFVT